MALPRPTRSMTVTELNSAAKVLLGSSPDLNDVWVSGEISNMTKHSSGHYYFTLKDEGSEIRCTLFRGARARLPFEPEENMKVLAFGSMDVYVRKGSYQFNVVDMRPSGIGELHKAFEALRLKLEKEGLFDPERKRCLPTFPMTVGVVTSPTGAAVRDILNVSARRFPSDIILAPALVQGEGAAETIVKAISLLNDYGVDVIIVGRGGGSLEDLWPFNEEAVARAIYASRIPIVSAVGHETDVTISDLVADMRAPTPSAAAELVLPDRLEETRQLDGLLGRAQKGVNASLERMRYRFKVTNARLSPKRAREEINHALMDLDEVMERARKGVNASQERMMHRFQLSEARLDLRRIRLAVDQHSVSLRGLWDSLSRSMRELIGNGRHRLEMSDKALEGLSPLSVLARGYCVVTGPDRATIGSVDDVETGSCINVIMNDGWLDAKVERKVKR